MSLMEFRVPVPSPVPSTHPIPTDSVASISPSFASESGNEVRATRRRRVASSCLRDAVRAFDEREDLRRLDALELPFAEHGCALSRSGAVAWGAPGRGAVSFPSRRSFNTGLPTPLHSPCNPRSSINWKATPRQRPYSASRSAAMSCRAGRNARAGCRRPRRDRRSCAG